MARASISLVSVQKPTANTPVLQRRNKFTSSIEQQITKIGLFREGKRISHTTDEIVIQAKNGLLSGLFLLFVPLSGLISYLILGSQNYAWINACGLLIVLHVLLDFHDDQSSPLSWREVLVHSLYVRCFSQRLHRSPDVLDDGPLCS